MARPIVAVVIRVTVFNLNAIFPTKKGEYARYVLVAMYVPSETENHYREVLSTSGKCSNNKDTCLPRVTLATCDG